MASSASPAMTNEVAGSTSPAPSPSPRSAPAVLHRQPASPSAGPVSPRIVQSIETDHGLATSFTPDTSGTSPASNKENATPQSSHGVRRKLDFKRPSERLRLHTPVHSPHGPPSSGLRIRLRGVQAALREYDQREAATPSAPLHHGGRKRARDMSPDADDDTDSELDIFASTRRVKKAAKRQARLLAWQAKKPRTSRDATDPVPAAGQQLSLVAPLMKRNARILDPTKAEHARLLANATKVGDEYYDSDVEDAAASAKDTHKPELFRNVVWGSIASDYSNPADFPTEPDFTQFVPGRFEILPDGTLADQKAKLIIKLTDKHGKKRIFANPPPRDWNSQEAITALNKRTVQQIRRNTNVRFRDVVQAYIAVERRWILDNLTAGKPTHGWKKFVDDFNACFYNKLFVGATDPRPYRTHSSLTKEVERFGAKFYTKGLVPVVAKKGKGNRE